MEHAPDVIRWSSLSLLFFCGTVQDQTLHQRAEADWPCLHLGNARWAGRVVVIKRVIFVCKTGDFWDFAKVGPVEWKLGWAGRVVVRILPGPVFSPSPPLPERRYLVKVETEEICH